MARLTGKTAFISGGAKGLGAEMARAMHEEGANVMVTDVLEDEGIKLADAHKNMQFMAHDVTDEAQWAAAIEATVKAFGGLDVLVNNAWYRA
jgi:3alpha(or 20beta)-hydroxysteroid dehydrogenase